MPQHEELHLVDLMSQHDAVRHRLANKSKEEVVAWLSVRGTLSSEMTYIRSPEASFARELFRFLSVNGLSTVFYFEGDELVVVGR